MPTSNAREGEWSRLVFPVAVLLASVAACSVMPPADAGTPPVACRANGADPWIGRAASTDIVDQARRASGSRIANLVMPGERAPSGARVDRLDLFLDRYSLITRATCG
ncbi:MAG: hypothetical protein EPO46_08435 [Lysobacter sp.]|nr:MAG: hypothetical protein EPO46_08435 [Lysobacter sp.]